jgi:hypothetical protein
MPWTFPPQLLQQYRKRAEAAAVKEANAILAKAKPLAPREGGDLEATGEVLAPVWQGDVCTVVIGFGGTPETAQYAVEQHERMDYKHEPGRQAKYLEAPANEALAGMSDRMAADIIEEMG